MGLFGVRFAGPEKRLTIRFTVKCVTAGGRFLPKERHMDVLFDFLFSFSSENVEQGQAAAMVWLALAVAVAGGIKALVRSGRKGH